MDKETQTYDLLHAHGLKKTPIRTEMLDIFLSHDFALSASDVVGRMKTAKDRVTVYRALASFEEHGILHKASEDRQGVKYALGDQTMSDGPSTSAACALCLRGMPSDVLPGGGIRTGDKHPARLLCEENRFYDQWSVQALPRSGLTR